MVSLAVVAAPYLAHERGGGPISTAAEVAVPWRPILLVGAALVLFYMVDTAAFTWGPTYLDRTVDAPSDLSERADQYLYGGGHRERRTG